MLEGQFKIVSSQGGGKTSASFEQQKTLNEWNKRDGMNSLQTLTVLFQSSRLVPKRGWLVSD